VASASGSARPRGSRRTSVSASEREAGGRCGTRHRAPTGEGP
jgi:hypothetical protein